ncbi:MAG: glutamine--fructose-6-phosphate transaminase (isomerizing) [Gammaproteobacteria bacterium]
MCGIVGGISTRNLTDVFVESLKRLEYRGYDSAGIAMLGDEKILRKRIKGKVGALKEALEKDPIKGQAGIAHTRWATHGVPSEKNAHPHCSIHEEFAVVHNGIIENFSDLRERLIKENYTFESETDTEVIAHLIHWHYQKTQDLLKAIQKTVKELTGAYALGVISIKEPGKVIGVRSGSPLVIGVGFDENFIASDHLALLPMTQRFIYLEEGDVVVLKQKNIEIYSKRGKRIEREMKKIDTRFSVSERGEYRHYMLKEIFEQPESIANLLEGRISQNAILEGIFGVQSHEIFPKVERVQITACGTAYHAGMVARYWIEEMAKIPCSVEVASELRYRHTVVPENTLFVCISQSGETADTLAALRQAKELGYLATLAICNVPESTIVREADMVFMTRAGAEIGVASTKAFTTQLVSLLLLTVALAKSHEVKHLVEHLVIEALHLLPNQIQNALELDHQIMHLAKAFIDKDHALFLGRGDHYPIALEGALKLKEISYIHAEAYPAGELKHGPLALVDEHMPVITVAPSDNLLEKLRSNIEEVRSRGGQLFIFTDRSTGIRSKEGVTVFEMHEVDKIIAPIVFTIPLQLLAYHVAVIKGTDVDQPRNLAKSVTVE